MGCRMTRGEWSELTGASNRSKVVGVSKFGFKSSFEGAVLIVVTACTGIVTTSAISNCSSRRTERMTKPFVLRQLGEIRMSLTPNSLLNLAVSLVPPSTTLPNETSALTLLLHAIHIQTQFSPPLPPLRLAPVPPCHQTQPPPASNTAMNSLPCNSPSKSSTLGTEPSSLL